MTTSKLACLSETDRDLAQLAAHIRNRHRSHLRDLRIEAVWGGVIIHGRASTFYGKQIAFHEVCSDGRFAVVANQIEVQARDKAALSL